LPRENSRDNASRGLRAGHDAGQFVGAKLLPPGNKIDGAKKQQPIPIENPKNSFVEKFA
jgi:hypothetical protein